MINWAELVVRLEFVRNAYGNVIGTNERKGPLGRHRHRKEDANDVDLKNED
jgi:hypothetical protein